jgi:hypothetical protein
VLEGKEHALEALLAAAHAFRKKGSLKEAGANFARLLHECVIRCLRRRYGPGSISARYDTNVLGARACACECVRAYAYVHAGGVNDCGCARERVFVWVGADGCAGVRCVLVQAVRDVECVVFVPCAVLVCCGCVFVCRVRCNSFPVCSRDHVCSVQVERLPWARHLVPRHADATCAAVILCGCERANTPTPTHASAIRYDGLLTAEIKEEVQTQVAQVFEAMKNIREFRKLFLEHKCVLIACSIWETPPENSRTD